MTQVRVGAIVAVVVLTVITCAEGRNKELTCIDFERGYTGSRGVWVNHVWITRIFPGYRSVDCPVGWCGQFRQYSRLEVPRFASAFTAWRAFSMSLWYKTDVNATMTLLRNDQCNDLGSLHLYTFHGDSVVGLMMASEGDFAMTASTGADLGVWNHVAVTWDGRTMRLYLNGDLQHKQSLTGKRLHNSKCPLMIGGPAYSTTMAPFEGYMDQICLYGRALKNKEIREMYNSP